MRSKNVLKNTIYELISQLLIIIRGFIIPKLIVNTFGSNINGLIVSITNFLGYIVLLEFGLTPIIKSQLYKPIANNDKNKINSILLSTNKFFNKIGFVFLIYIIILLLVYPFIITNNFSISFIDSLIIIISLSTIFEYFMGMTYKIYIQASGNSYLVSFIDIIVNIINTITIIILINFNCDIVIIKLLSSILFIIKPLFFYYYVKKKFNINIKKGKDYKIENKRDGISQHIAYVIHTKTDIVVLTLFSTLTNVSIYSIYSIICLGIRNLVKGITIVL